MNCPEHLMPNPDIKNILEFPQNESYHDAVKVLITEYIAKLNEYYISNGINEDVGYQTIFLPRELIRNAYAHGGGNKNIITLGIFLSPTSAVVGCNDKGDYFKDDKIKKLWEQRMPIISRGMQHRENGEFISGYNNGIKMIYGMTDEIFIDIKTGTFFGKFNPLIYNFEESELEKIFKKRNPYNL